MTRLLGAALVVAGCVSLGLCAVAWLDGRVRDLGELAAGLDALQRELGWRLSPLPQALEGAARTGREALNASSLRLRGEDKALLERLGGVLGRYDGDSQRLALEDAAAGLRTLQGAAADERSRLGRVYGVLGAAAGLLAVILLL